MRPTRWLLISVIFFTLTPLDRATAAQVSTDVEHAIVGTIQKVDAGGKTVVIKTADGVVTVLKLTERTVVRSADAVGRGTEAAARATGTAGREAAQAGATAALATKEGAEAIVRYTGEGAEKTAVFIEDVGKGTLKVIEGTVVRVGEGGRTVVLKTADGVEHVFDLAERGAVDTGKGLLIGADAVAKGVKVGTKVTVHYTEEAGTKIARLFKWL